MHTFAPEEKIKYHNDMTTERDIRNQIVYAHDTGLAEGLEKGIEKGLAEGLEKGIEQERLKNARNFKKLGVSIPTIAEATGLSEDQIEAL